MSAGLRPQPAASAIPRNARRLVAALTAVAALLLGAACSGSSRDSAASPAPFSAGAGAPSGQGAAAQGDTLAQVPEVVRQVEPSVVTIFTQDGLGSGVVYSGDGLVVTNEHVVRGNDQVRVAFADGRRVSGRVRATDTITDLALVQADRRDLPAARFQPAPPQVGELAVVLGSPLGFENTATAGIISGLNREIPGSGRQGQSLVNLLQTDAAISPGNSGGAVLNGRGEVVGISEAYIPPQAGAVALGFAIPAAVVVDVAEQLKNTGRVEHAFAGLHPAAITPQIAQRLGLPSTDGVLVLDVVAGGPAERAGLRPGDVITRFDSQPVRSVEGFLGQLRPHRPGDRVPVTVLRGNQTQEFTLQLAARPDATS